MEEFEKKKKEEKKKRELATTASVPAGAEHEEVKPSDGLGAALGEEDLQELFVQTSNFTVTSAMKDGSTSFYEDE